MVERKRVFAVAGLLTSGFAATFLIGSFSSQYWVESNKSVSPSGFERMGLWEACFHNYYPINRPITNKKYEGCWAAISYDMRDLYDHFFPSWMRAVQGMMTLAMLQAVACVIINIIYFIHCCTGRMERYFALISAIIAFIAALFLFISTIMFGIHVDQDRNWLPQPGSIYLSWAFGFGILAAILLLVSAMCMITDFIRLRMEGGPYDRHEDLMTSRQNARYAAPPQKYDAAVKYEKRSESAPPPSHLNPGYSPPQADSWHNGRNSGHRKTNAVPPPPPSPSPPPPPPPQKERYSQSEDDDEGVKLNGRNNKGSRQKGRHSDSEAEEHDEKPQSRRKKKVPRQNGHYSAPEYDYDSDDRSRESETHSRTGRPSHRKPKAQHEDEDKKPHERHASKEHSSRRSGARQSESDPHSHTDGEKKSHDRHTERSSRHGSRRSEPRSRSNDETRSVDRHSNSSRHSRPNPRYSEQFPEEEEVRTHSKRVDGLEQSSRRKARNSESQSGREESKLYSRRSGSSKSPSRQNSRRSESQPRHDGGTRQRY
ncbi:hypothetical protein ACOMHN_034445 [Nucella lapillus]